MDIIVKDMEEDLKNDGLDMEPDRDFERSLMDQYTVSYREYGTATVFFMPESWDIDKARDAYSILTTDMEKSVQFSMDTKYDGKLTFDPKNFSVTDMEGQVYDSEKDIDFAEAVESIPTNENGLEQ